MTAITLARDIETAGVPPVEDAHASALRVPAYDATDPRRIALRGVELRLFPAADPRLA